VCGLGVCHGDFPDNPTRWNNRPGPFLQGYLPKRLTGSPTFPPQREKPVTNSADTTLMSWFLHLRNCTAFVAAA
jgi:hypothetical protein